MHYKEGEVHRLTVYIVVWQAVLDLTAMAMRGIVLGPTRLEVEMAVAVGHPCTKTMYLCM